MAIEPKCSLIVLILVLKVPQAKFLYNSCEWRGGCVLPRRKQCRLSSQNVATTPKDMMSICKKSFRRPVE